MSHFQAQMERFLEMQQRLVMSYIERGHGVDPSSHPGSGAEAIGNALAGAQPEQSLRDPNGATGVRIPFESTGEPSGAATKETSESIQRWTLQAVPIAKPEKSCSLGSHQVVLITDDERGIAASLARKLDREGIRSAILQPESGTTGPVENHFQLDWTSPEQIRDVLGKVRETLGPIGSLVHLAPLGLSRPYPEMEFQDWIRQTNQECISLFLLAQAIGPELEEAAGQDGAVVLGVTAMGGTFAVDAASEFPGHGGVLGLTKTLAREWPTVRVRAVDLSPDETPDQVSQHLFSELFAPQEHLEVGYRQGRRFTVQEHFSPPQGTGPSPDSDWIWLLTGGARGITAEIAMELAERYQPTLILVGTSPLPENEPSDVAPLTDPRQIRAALLTGMKARGERPAPREVERAYQTLIKSREIRDNLTAMKQAGARVFYRTADVRDEDGFGALLKELYTDFGHIDGVVHGAGIIEDKLIQDKSLASFQRVFSTKVESAFILSRYLNPDSVRLMVFFSSVSGRLGNRGQGDYAAANQILSKVATLLNDRWQGRVVSIDWGPWDKMGMVSDELRREFARRGWVQIPPAEGRSMFCEEICQAGNEAEVVIAGRTHGEKESRIRVGTQPLLEGMTLDIQEGKVEILYTLDPGRDYILNDHRMDGRAVLPVAEAAELMAELAQDGWPHLKVAGLSEVRVQRGIILKNQIETIRVTAKAQPAADGPGLDVAVEITELESGRVPFYRGTVLMRDQLPAPVRYSETYQNPLTPYTGAVEEAYRQHLFHGPALQNITALGGFNEEGMVGTVRASSASASLSWKPRNDWIIDPVVVDSGFQIAWIWARIVHQVISLPSYFPVYRRYAPLAGEEIRCYLHTKGDPETLSMVSALYMVDTDGWVLGSFHRVESTLSRVLNRLVDGEKV